MIRHLSCLLFFAAAVTAASAQTRTVTVSGMVNTTAVTFERGMMQYFPIQGATVTLMTARDTMRTSTNNYGYFVFKKVPEGKATLVVTHVSYKVKTVEAEIKTGTEFSRRILLEEEATEIQEVQVKGKVPPVTMSGDTLIFNAAAVKTFEDDATVEILRQMPGVEVGDDGSVSVLGESVARTYVNSKLIFGDDPKAVLKELLAKEVVKIKTFYEPTDKDRLQGFKSGQKQRAMDIVTKNPIFSSATGHFFATGGTDIAQDPDGDRKVRYGAGANANFFSEKLEGAVTAMTSNTGESGNNLASSSAMSQKGTDSRVSSASIRGGKFWGERRDMTGINGRYGYTNNRTITESNTWKDYFATDLDPARTDASSLRNDIHTSTHAGSFSSGVMTGKAGIFRIGAEGSVNVSDTDNASTRLLSVEGVERENSASTTARGIRSTFISPHTSWISSRIGTVTFALAANASFSDSDGSEVMVDTLSSVYGQRILSTSLGGPSRTMNANVEISKFFSQSKKGERESSIGLSYGISDNYSRSRQTAHNIYDPEMPLDSVNTYNYTNSNTSHNLKLSYLGAIGEYYFILASLNGQANRINRDEMFPEQEHDGHIFYSLSPAFNINKVKNGSRRFYFDYNASINTPSLEMLRDRIDNTDLLNISQGNPSLKQGTTHTFMVGGPNLLDMKKGRSLTLSANGYITNNVIARKSTFYAAETPLPELDGEPIAAGGTFSTWVNAGTSYKYEGRAYFFWRFPSIGSSLNSNITYTHSSLPTYTHDVRNILTTDNITWGASFSMTSRKLRFGVRPRVSYAYSYNTLGSDRKQLSGLVQANAEWFITQNLSLKTNYHYSLVRFPGYKGSNRDEHMLSVHAGYKILKKKGALSLVGYDLLNRETGFSSSVTNDYVVNSWSSSFGRYWALRFTYNFHSLQSGKSRRQDGVEYDGNIIMIESGGRSGLR